MISAWVAIIIVVRRNRVLNRLPFWEKISQQYTSANFIETNCSTKNECVFTMFLIRWNWLLWDNLFFLSVLPATHPTSRTVKHLEWLLDNLFYAKSLWQKKKNYQKFRFLPISRLEVYNFNKLGIEYFNMYLKSHSKELGFDHPKFVRTWLSQNNFNLKN